jgi:proteasome accessory factor PafA2
MSLPKVVGIEQEYAIVIKGDGAPAVFDASCLLVNAVARHFGLRGPRLAMTWDYGHETPYQDIRGRMFGKNTGEYIISEKENQLINAPLPNGARLYTDHAHPEYATPECRSARQVLACDKAGERLLRIGLTLLQDTLPGVHIYLYKNNTDSQGHSYGCHENYLMAAATHEDYFVTAPEKALRALIPFLVTRQVFAGAGKIVREATGPAYRISQRADFMEKIFGLQTMYARSLINTRQEHHADPERFRRLHLILGDANMCEFAALLKIGSTQLVLQMLEDGAFTPDLTLSDPIDAVKRIAMDFAAPIALADGRSMTAVDIQREYLAAAMAYQPSDAAHRIPDDGFILDCWATALDGLARLRLTPDLGIEDDPMELRRRLDWVLKLWTINRYRQGKGRHWGDPQLGVLDLQYHNIDPGEGLFYSLQEQGFVEQMLNDAAIQRHERHPPEDTRAWFRGKCIEKFAPEICLLNWEVVGFDQGEVHRMVPLLNPLKGGQSQYSELFARARHSRDLIAQLESTMHKEHR